MEQTIEEQSRKIERLTDEIHKLRMQVESEAIQSSELLTQQSLSKQDRAAEYLDKVMDRPGDRFDYLVQAVLAEELLDVFSGYGLSFGMLSQRTTFSLDKSMSVCADFFLEDTGYAMHISVYEELSIKAIDSHMSITDEIRSSLSESRKNRKLFGAIATMSVSKDVLEHAHKNGVLVVVFDADAVWIADAPEGFKLREW